MLSTQDQWKVAFLLACAEEGLSIEETHDRIKEALALVESGALEKAAAPGGGGLLGRVGSTLGRTLGYFGDKALNLSGQVLAGTGRALGTAALLAPVTIGGVAGYSLGKGTGTSEEDVEAAKQQELIEAYHSAAERARMRARSAQRKTNRPVNVRSLV